MQTFLPYEDFWKTASILDYRRLGKQRVEAKQILQTLSGESKGWMNHPAVRMWKGYEDTLAIYGCIMCIEWKRRGYEDNTLKYFTDFIAKNKGSFTVKRPKWLNKKFINSHRSNLLRKDKKYYSKFRWKIKDDLPYEWQV